MVGVRSTINRFSVALSAGYMEVEDGDGSWTNIVGRDTEGKSLDQMTYRLVTKYQFGKALWAGLELVHSELSGMREAEDYKGQSCMMHINYNF